MNNMALYLALGTSFGFLGGLAAFLITLEEYQHHFIDKKKALRHSIESGLFAFFIFLGIAMLVGFIFSYLRF